MKFSLYLLILILSRIGVQAGAIKGKVNYPGVARHGIAVVYAERIPKEPVLPPGALVILDQVNLKFIPHVLPIVMGTTVRFPNSDEVRHNVFSFSPAKLFNLGIYRKGETRQVTFDQPGEVVLLCNIHSEMSAYVLVLETPYFTVTSEEGSYRLPGLPPGKYAVTVWHERFESISTQVEITAERDLPLGLKLMHSR